MTNIELLRVQSGISPNHVARRCRVCPRYWRQIELHGRAPLVLARRAARVLGCSANALLFPAKPLPLHKNEAKPIFEASSADGDVTSLERLEPARLLLIEGGAARSGAAPRRKRKTLRLTVI